MNLVLIGYRGTGKSAVGRRLAERLKMPLVNLDAAIVAKAGMRIPDIVAAHGWSHFRDLESAVVREIAGQDGRIVDCGGGVVERAANIVALKENGVVFWLTAPVELIVRRIETDTERPALTAGKSFLEEVSEVLARRNPLYEAAADHAVGTENRTVEEVASAVVSLWHRGQTS